MKAGRLSLPVTALSLILCVVPLTSLPAHAEDYPTAAHPWEKKDLASRRDGYQKELQALMALPAEQVRPHPAAADFPGLPPADAPAVERTIYVAGKTPRWHGTGLYAAPGQLITVTVPADAAKIHLEVRIGCHTDELWYGSITSWTRAPQISRAFAITTEVTHAANGFGGLIYINVPDGAPADAAWDIKVEGGIAAPRFVLGQTTLANWHDALRNAPAPWAELECDGLILTVPSTFVRKLDDPANVMTFWNTVVEAEDDLAGIRDRKSPERFVFDRQISAGYMHSGYPLMGPADEAPAKMLDVPADLTTGDRFVWWGAFHELGHNHQSSAWTFDGTVEVTTNIFSFYCFDHVVGINRHLGHPEMDQGVQDQRLRRYLMAGSFKQWKDDPFLALTMYDQLIEAFGFESLEKVFVEYRDLPADQRPKNDQQKRDQFMVRFSRVVGKNLGPFYEKWKVPTGQAARDSIAELPEWMPEWPATSSGPLKIVKAVWGDLADPTSKSTADVSAILTKELKQSTIKLIANNENLGGDPAENVRKRLRVEYTVEEHQYFRTIEEGDTLLLTGNR